MKKHNYFILILALAVLFFASCQSNSSTTLESSEIKNKEERIKILTKHIKDYSEIVDTEFSLFNANGFESSFTFLPAASHSDYKMAIKVDKNNIEKWLVGMYEAKKPNAQDSVWIHSILEKIDSTRRQNWKESIAKSTPKRFIISPTNGRSKIALVYQNEGVIFERIIQN